MAIPSQIKQGLDRYAKDGIPPGSFLENVISNNLFGALITADDTNKNLLLEIMQYVHIKFPQDAWGSNAKYERWIKRKAQGVPV